MERLKTWIGQQIAAIDPGDPTPADHYAAIVAELKHRTYAAGLYSLSVSLPIEDRKWAISAAGQLRRVLEELDTVEAPSDYLSIKQAAAVANLGERTVYRLCASGELTHSRVGRAIRIKQSDLLAYLSAMGNLLHSPHPA